MNSRNYEIRIIIIDTISAIVSRQVGETMGGMPVLNVYKAKGVVGRGIDVGINLRVRQQIRDQLNSQYYG